MSFDPASGNRPTSFSPERVAAMRRTSSLRLGRSLTAQQEANVAVRFHPHQPVVISGWYGAESHVDLWDLRTGDNLHSLTLIGTGHASEATGVSRMAGPQSQGTLPVRDLDVSPDGHLLAVAAGLSVWVLDLGATARLMREGEELCGHHEGVHSVAFNHRGDLIASVCDEGRVIVWSLQTFQPLSTYRMEEGRLRAVAFNCDDTLLAVGDVLGNVSVWDVFTGHQRAWFQAHESDISALRFHPRRNVLATAGFDGSVRLWDIDVEQPLGDGFYHNDAVYDLRFGLDGNLLYSCGFDQLLGVWQTEALDLIDCFEASAPILAMDVANDEHRIALVTANDIQLIENRLPGSALPDESVRPGMTLQDALGLGARKVGPALQPKPPLPAQDDIVADAVDDTYLQARREGAASGLINLAASGRGGPKAAPGRRYGPGSPHGSDSSVPTRDTAPSLPPGGAEGPRSDDELAGNLPTRAMIGSGGKDAPAPVGLVHSPTTAATRALTPDHRYNPDASLRGAIRIDPTPAEPHSNARAYTVALIVALILGALGGGVGYLTAPRASDDPANQQKALEFASQAEQARQSEVQRHAPVVQNLQARIDKAKQGGGSQNITPIVKGLEKNLDDENQRHQQTLDQIDAQLQVQLQTLKVDPGFPTGRVLAFALPIAGIAALLLAFILSRMVWTDKGRR